MYKRRQQRHAHSSEARGNETRRETVQGAFSWPHVLQVDRDNKGHLAKAKCKRQAKPSIRWAKICSPESHMPRGSLRNLVQWYFSPTNTKTKNGLSGRPSHSTPPFRGRTFGRATTVLKPRAKVESDSTHLGNRHAFLGPSWLEAMLLSACCVAASRTSSTNGESNMYHEPGTLKANRSEATQGKTKGLS